MLGLKQSLTPSRNNGFLNMFRWASRARGVLPGEAGRVWARPAAELDPHL
jgi:hypothetical protein